ncbi:transcription initiation at TATA-containing promoter protein [Sporothrix curviconia]|uniref:Transcription initiation at TATA-containing promoter protein n=1 Tax=Sporothrix curviconia TaxID=1260050 RepID=A0ABP0CWW2_9PEZI
MASLSDEQLPASNGVNGHSDDVASAKPSPTQKESSVPAEKSETPDLAGNLAKNVDAFEANSAPKPAETTATPDAPEAEKPVDDVAKSEPAADESEDVKKEAIDAPADAPAKETGAEAPAATPADKPLAADTKAEESEKDTPAEAEKPSVESASADDLESAAPAAVTNNVAEPESALKSTDEELAPPPKPASPSPETDKDGDVDMVDVAPATSKEATPAPAPTSVAPAPAPPAPPEPAAAAEPTPPPAAVAKAASPEKAKSPAAPPSLAHSISSSLLPSLRDDRSRENSSSAAVHDTIMADASGGKVAREREDDDEAGPLAKRAKTEDADAPAASEASAAAATEMQIDVTPVAMPARVRAMAKEGSLADPSLDGSSISGYANREIRRVLASVKKTKAGNNFKDPVHKKWPLLWDAYTARVAKPVDIGMLERNLRENAYATHGEFISDLFLIFENSVSFNGLGNAVTDEAKSLVDNFFTRLSEISAHEPQKHDKKEPKQLPTRQTEPRAAQRRESRGAATSPIEDSSINVSAAPPAVSTTFGNAPAASASSPGAAAPVEASTPVFAVPSSGVPIIRRDSAKNDGDRPKRPIHPPKNRDLGYEPKNPKKKLPEFRFCEEVLKELVKAKHYESNHWFLKPVDAVALQIPTYHKVIKKPMDLGTMQTKLNLGEYTSAKDFENDFSLIVKNCRKFNIAGEVVDAANRLEDLFKQKWAEKDSWIAAHTTQTATHSPSAKDEDSDEDAEDSDDEGGDLTMMPLSSDTIDGLVKRLEEENARLKKLLDANVPDMTSIMTQQVVTNMIQKQIVEEKLKLSAAEADRRAKKPAKARPAKGKKAAGGGGGGAAAKKAGGGGAKKAGGAVRKAQRPRHFGQAEKSVVTDGINSLDGQQLEKAIDIIKKDTSQEESESGELELDIDQLSQDALGKLYELIVKAFPHMRVKPEKVKATDSSASGKPNKPKKHKPMGKLEQERNIEKLREIKAQFQRPGSGSQEPLPSVEVGQAVEEEESEEEESEVDSEEE